MTTPTPYATTDEAAAYLRTTTGALGALRYRGGGPRWRRAGRRVLYAWRDLDVYLEQTYTTTADYTN